MTPFDINNITRENIKALSPYQVWRDDYLHVEGTIFLDNGENNYGSPLGKGYERYPSSSQKEVKEAIARLKNVEARQVALGNGSDEMIATLIMCFCEPGRDNILVCEPTFGMFSLYARINNIGVLNAPLTAEDFSFDTDLILQTKNDNTKLVFICSPNNPTGTSISRAELARLCGQFQGLVVLDEAYVDFSDKGSMAGLIRQFPNLLVLQTFSKAWGLAALRLGIALGHPDTIRVIEKVRPPFNINGMAQQLILEAIGKQAIKDGYIKKILEQKAALKKELVRFSFVERMIDSDANYFLMKVKNAQQLFDFLLSRNILISNRSASQNCENHVRISIGTREENETLLAALIAYK